MAQVHAGQSPFSLLEGLLMDPKGSLPFHSLVEPAHAMFPWAVQFTYYSSKCTKQIPVGSGMTDRHHSRRKLLGFDMEGFQHSPYFVQVVYEVS